MFFKGSVEKASSWRWMKLKRSQISLKSYKRDLVNGADDGKGERIGSLELTEDVGVFGRDAGGLQHRYPEGEQVADLQVLQRGVHGAVQTRLYRVLGLVCTSYEKK